MTDIHITITGTTGLLCNKFSDEAAEKATSGRTSSMSSHDRGTQQEQAQARLYVGADGKTLIIPSPNLLRCIVDGGLFHKAGRSKITTQRSSLLYSCVDIQEIEIPIKHKQPWRVDTRAVRIPATGGRILCNRPCFDDWSLTFTVTLDTDTVGVKLFRAIVDDAGKKIGLGDFRPSTKGPFGKFVVTLWKEATVEVARGLHSQGAAAQG